MLLTGCGGGFDFVHSMTLVPELKRLGKRIVIGSYSFGDPAWIQGGHRVELEGVPLTVIADASCSGDRRYGPEVGMCQFLDEEYPSDKPHRVYAYNARHFTVATLTTLLSHICNENEVDAVVSVDGGSDSLMAGDEAGLGDPIEDATTVATIALLKEKVPRVRAAMLLVMGFGCDRFNTVSDAASLRAVAELNAAGGFLGSMSLEFATPPMQFYSRCLDFLNRTSTFRSVIANSITESSRGAFGSDVVPTTLRKRVNSGELYLWPLMSFQFAFSIEHVFRRSLLGPELVKCTCIEETYATLRNLRHTLKKDGKLRNVELLPSPEPAAEW